MGGVQNPGTIVGVRNRRRSWVSSHRFGTIPLERNTQMAASILRVENPYPEQFLADVLPKNEPIVITGALDAAQLDPFWTPQYLGERFGRRDVQIYNDYFDLTSVGPLERYLSRHFGRTGPITRPVPYVRWYSRLRDVEFAWSDPMLAAMRPHWTTPRCVPVTDLVLPYAPAPRVCDPAEHRFPGRGLFISGRGARTGLHRDPWASDAFLCQLYGSKTWRLFAPEQAPLLTSGTKTVDLERIDANAFPRAAQARADFEFTQHAGEMVYVPHGWFHTVHSASDSISLTWNFVHRSKQRVFQDWLDAGASGIDLQIARYFLGDEGLSAMTAAGMERRWQA
jgi:hypothetical protein